MVRAKFRLTAITDYGGTSRTFRFNPQYDMTIPEDQRFCRATPSGELTVHVDNPAAIEQLVLNQDYYLDFTPVPKPEG